MLNNKSENNNWMTKYDITVLELDGTKHNTNEKLVFLIILIDNLLYKRREHQSSLSSRIIISYAFAKPKLIINLKDIALLLHMSIV